MEEIIHSVPPSSFSIFLVLVLSFVIGLEREEHASGTGHYNFGGVRTFPIIGLSGYLISRLSSEQPLFLAVGFLVLGAFLWLSYKKKLERSPLAGMTSEASGLFTYLMGALVARGFFWDATALSVLILLLLEFKKGLETLARRIPPEEIFTFTRFLLISAVILPIVPNEKFTEFQINPFRVWLIVVVISSLSYLSYVIGKLLGQGKGILLTAVLGGVYSSTATTVTLARRSRTQGNARLISGAILVASGVMYFRILILLFLFNAGLGRMLLLPFLGLGILTTGFGFLFSRKTTQDKPKHSGSTLDNPLELKSAFLFGFLFILMAVLVQFFQTHFGGRGLFLLSFLSGFSDVDPMVMSLTQSGGHGMDLVLAAKCIVIAISSNHILKGIYAAIAATDGVRSTAPWLLVALSFLSGLTFFLI